MLSGLKDGPVSDKHKETKAILEGLGEIREKEEPDFAQSRVEYMEFLKNPNAKL